jgi:hypothetical protein
MTTPPCRVAVAMIALVGLGLTSCADQSAATDADAVTACHEALTARGVSKPPPWPTTTGTVGDDWRVNVWTSGRAEGIPNYVCEVARTDSGHVSVTEIRP